MLVVSISSDGLFLAPKNEENIVDKAIFVIVVVGRWASFYRIYDRQNVLASKIF